MAFPILQTKLFIPPARSDRVPREHLVRRLDEALQAGRRLVLISATAGSGKTSLLMELDLSQEQVLALEGRTEGWAVGLQLAALALQSLPPSQPDPGQKEVDTLSTDSTLPNLPPSSFSLQPSSPTTAFIQSFTGTHQYLLDYLTEEVLNRQPPEVQSFLLQTSILDRLCAELCDATIKDEGERMKDEKNTGYSDFILHPFAFILEMLHRSNLFLIPLDLEGRWFRYHHLFAGLLGVRLRGQASLQEVAGLHLRASRWFEANGFLDEAVRHGLEAGDFDRVAALVERAAQAGIYSGRVATLLSWFAALPEGVRQARPRLRLSLAWAHFLNGQAGLAEKMLLELRPTLQDLPDAPENRLMLGELFNYLATIASIRGDTAQIHELAGQALAYLPEADRVGRARVKIALGTAFGLDGEMDSSNQAFRQAAELARAAGNTFLLAHILELLASNFGHQGRLREVAGAYQEVIELAGAAAEPGVGPAPPAPEGAALAPGASIAGIGYIGLAEVSLERNELDLAALQLERGFELCRQGGISYNLVSGYLTRAYLKKALGDHLAAVEAFRQAEGLFASIHSLAYAVLLAAHQVRLRLWEDGLDAIPDWDGPDRRISIFDLPGQSLPISVREIWWVTLARLHLARGEVDRVPALYDRVCATAEPGGRLARVIEVSMIHALALQALGAPQAAAVALERSLALGGPEGYVRLFIDEGEAIEDLLKVIRLKVEGGDLRTSVDHLLAALAAEKPGQDSLPGANKSIPTFKPSNLQPYSKQPPTLIEPLSERELEVLRLVGAGYSNGEIAAQLFLSLNTVKKHTSNIFGKLGVDSRTQAAAVARQLGLLGEG